MPVVYDREGAFYRMEPAAYQAKEGEAAFSDIATPDELAKAFSGYADAMKNPSPFA